MNLNSVVQTIRTKSTTRFQKDIPLSSIKGAVCWHYCIQNGPGGGIVPGVSKTMYFSIYRIQNGRSGHCHKLLAANIALEIGPKTLNTLKHVHVTVSKLLQVI